MASPIQGQGFGLNYNQGFGSGATYFGGGLSPTGDIAAQGYQQRLGNKQQNAFQSGQLQQQLGFGREQLAADTATKQQGYNAQRDVANTQAAAAELPAQLQQQRFNTVFPFLSQQLGQGNSSYGYNGQGQAGTQPSISAAPVYNDQQIQQQVNSQRAANDASTASSQRNMQQTMSARGYGGNSPLAQELGVGLQNQNLQSNTDVERQTRFDAAGANSKQVLAAQNAQEQQFASRQQEDIERNKVYQSKYNALLAAMSGMV